MSHCLNAGSGCVMWGFGGLKSCACPCDSCFGPGRHDEDKDTGVVYGNEKRWVDVERQHLPARKLDTANEADIRAALLTILDCVDYSAGHCRVNEQVGAVLPLSAINLARKALAR